MSFEILNKPAFTLIGLLLQEADFPCFALPVIASGNDKYVVTYLNDSEQRLYKIEEDFTYIRCSPKPNFQIDKTRILFVKKNHYLFFDLHLKGLFFRILLINQRFSYKNPFFRHELTRELNDFWLRYQELQTCVAILRGCQIQLRFERNCGINNKNDMVSGFDLSYSESKNEQFQKRSPSWLKQKIYNWENKEVNVYMSIWTIMCYIGWDEDDIQDVFLYMLEQKIAFDHDGIFEHLIAKRARNLRIAADGNADYFYNNSN